MLSGQSLARLLDCTTVGLSTAEAAVEVDMANAEGVLFIGVIHSTAARKPTMTFELGASTTSYVAVSSTHTYTSTAAGTNIVLIADVFKPPKRYVKCTLTTTTATPSNCIALKYGLRKPSTGYSGAGTNLPTANGGFKTIISPSSAT